MDCYRVELSLIFRWILNYTVYMFRPEARCGYQIDTNQIDR